MDWGLKGKVAVVTGGGLGIGKAVASFLATQGMGVVIAQRRMTVLESAAAEIRSATGARVVPIAVDTTDMAAVESMVAQAVTAFGRLDVLVNGAAHPGGLVRNEIESTDATRLLQDLDIKVVGYLRCTQAVVPHMKRIGYGRVINIGGLTARGSKVLSGMRNVAVCHMTKTLSDQLGPFGITVNVIHPGVVETEHIHELYEKEAQKQGLTAAAIEANYISATPIRRIILPEEVASAVGFLASPLAGAITGESIAVDGGYTRGIFI